MQRRCLDCGLLIASGSRCRACREAYRGAAARTTLPAAVKQRDGYRCVDCGEFETRTQRLQAHHVLPLSEGGSNTLDNMVTLCTACHKARHRARRSFA